MLSPPRSTVSQVVFGLWIIFHNWILPALPFHVFGGKVPLTLLRLWISHYLHTLWFQKPLLSWAVAVLLLQSNNWGKGKKIKTVPGKAKLNSASQFQAEKALPLTFHKLHWQPPLKFKTKIKFHLNDSSGKEWKIITLRCQVLQLQLKFNPHFSSILKKSREGGQRFSFEGWGTQKSGFHVWDLQKNNKSVK